MTIRFHSTDRADDALSVFLNGHLQLEGDRCLVFVL
jgi:hypothetical protein